MGNRLTGINRFTFLWLARGRTNKRRDFFFFLSIAIRIFIFFYGRCVVVLRQVRIYKCAMAYRKILVENIIVQLHVHVLWTNNQKRSMGCKDVRRWSTYLYVFVCVCMDMV